MQSNFNNALQHTLKEEGGFVNNSHDPGGMTNLGVTARTWADWVGHDPSEKEMRELTPAKVTPLYKRRYWDACHADELVSGLDYCVFDTAVNSGPGRAIKLLQECVGVKPDGSLGPVTLSAVKAMDPVELIHKYTEKRIQFWQGLPTFGTFGRGWVARGERVQQAALSMV